MKPSIRRLVTRAVHRIVAAALVPALLPAGIPTVAADPDVLRPAGPPAAAPAAVTAHRLPAPTATRPTRRPDLSAATAPAAISAAHVFEEPLAPEGPTTVEENRALGGALERYLQAASPEDLAPLDAFLQAHPRSAWRVALLANLGVVAHRTGHFSKALAYHEQAWRAGRESADPRTRALADRAVSEWAWLLMGLGHQDALASLLRDVEGRSFSGSAAERIRTARQGLWLMEHRPEEAFRCGPVALSRVLTALGHPYQDEVGHAPGSARGTSLGQVRSLAARVGVALQMGRRLSASAPLPAPAVVHFKTGHFAALVERSGDRYRVADPVFDEERWISAAALDAETTGYVLAASLPEGFSPVGDEEARTVWGRSCPNRPDPSQQQPCEPSSGGDCSGGTCHGMAGYTFLPLLTALRIRDTPLTYRPAKGPEVGFTLTYNQREVFQPAVFSYVNVGPKWTFDAVSYVEDDPATAGPQTVRVYRRGGGMEIYAGLTGSTPSAPDFRTRAVLVRVSASPVRYERRMPDGAVEVFAQPDGVGAFPRRVFLTEEADAHGNALSFVYGDSLQIEAIVDAMGLATTFAYGDAAGLRISSITDPFGRRATLTYDAQGRLAGITDALGLTSSFTYGAADFIDSMTTPYGTTRFTTGDSGLRTWIEAEDPMGARERAEYVITHDSSIGPRTLPAAQVPVGFSTYNGNFDAGLTLYWDKRAMMLAPGDSSKAEITHWLEQLPTHRPRGVIRARKKPLEGRVWYGYLGQTTSHGNDGRMVKMGQLLDDPDGGGPLAAPTQAWTFVQNLAGKACSMIDPLGRETRYTYGTGNVPDPSCAAGSSVDLLKVEQKNGSGWDVVRTYTYNAQHLPLTDTDGAMQTTTYEYDADGLLAKIATPPRAGITEERTTTFAHDPVTRYLLAVTSPGAVTTSYTYDAYGRRRTMTSNDGDVTTFDYDAFDRATRTTFADQTYEETVYDRLDAARFRDRLGRWSETFRDPLRRIVSQRDPAGEVHQEWCTCGSLNRFLDANGNVTSWERDLQGRVSALVRADTSREQYAYELTTSRLRQKTDAKQQVTQYTYALDGQPLRTQFLQAQHPTPDVTFDYTDPATGQPDAHGRLHSMTDGIGTTTYTYRPFGQLGAGNVQAVDGALAADAIVYGYDERGRTTTRDFGGTVASRSYDQQGRLQSQSDAIGTFLYAYEGNTRRLSTLTYPNGQTSTYTYHGSADDRRLQGIAHRKPDGIPLNLFSYTYDDVGNILTWSRQVDGDRARVFHLEYDLADQLVAATDRNPAGGDPPLKRYRYAYDAAGNRTAEQVDDSVTGATYNGMNQLLSQQPGGELAFRGAVNEAATVTVASRPATVTAGNEFAGQATVPSGVSNVAVTARDYANNVRTNTYQVTATGATRGFTYDANGNLESKTEGGVTTTYEWDAANRLLAVKQGAATLVSFAYDGRGRRAQRTSGGVVRSYVFDDDEILEERNSNGLVLRFVDAPQIDRHLAQYAPGGAPVYLLSDHLGSVVRQTNSAGAPTFAREYDPWGNLLAGASAGRYAYTGREWDPQAGLYYYRARYYDPQSGRFLSQDPLGLSDGPNRYAYVRSNPVRSIDPFGTSCFSATITIMSKCDVDVLEKKGDCPWVVPGFKVCGALTKNLPITLSNECAPGFSCEKTREINGSVTETQVITFVMYKAPGGDWAVKGDPPPGSSLCTLTVRGKITGTMKGWAGECKKPGAPGGGCP